MEHFITNKMKKNLVIFFFFLLWLGNIKAQREPVTAIPAEKNALPVNNAISSTSSVNTTSVSVNADPVGKTAHTTNTIVSLPVNTAGTVSNKKTSKATPKNE